MTIVELTHRVIKKASQSTCRYKIGAIGLNAKGELVGTSINKPRFSRYGGGIHSEMGLMKQYGKKLKTIIICRVNNNGNLLPIKPCKVCSKKAKDLGIKIYSIMEN